MPFNPCDTCPVKAECPEAHPTVTPVDINNALYRALPAEILNVMLVLTGMAPEDSLNERHEKPLYEVIMAGIKQRVSDDAAQFAFAEVFGGYVSL